MNKYGLTALLACAFAANALAQSATNSPYSQYGLGVLADQSQGTSRGMNGLGIGLRSDKIVNSLNPASYSATDSLTMLFDVGLAGQLTNYRENGASKNATSANFEYAAAAFRVANGVGMSLGLVPYSNIGYKYYTNEYVGGLKSTYNTETHKGEGGLHEVYLGIGARLFGGLSVGVNGGFLWGNYSRSIVNSSSVSSDNTLSRYYTASINNYKLDFGLQYEQPLGKKDALTIGLTYGFGHKLGADAQCQTISYNSSTSVSDTTTVVSENALRIPHTFGVGFTYRHANRMTIGADYQLQKWGSVTVDGSDERGVGNDWGHFKDRHKITLGGEFVPNEDSRSFLKQMHYRAGVSYTTPYLIINGANGPREIAASVGVGIPIVNRYNNRSIVNVSAQWVNSSASGLVTENMFRINVGITFNERWFMKWKFD